ncbi:hypothetical protein EXIGLDRAFT_745690 [Exidia glandulosa HHB12029]|uniref:F-box domain-containing protein n=1 Tax=Exidia glandulosa HHB12029 TaxID=1314781 RepID=A0A165NAD5_EXIGL|nr:hypothetical protein EXIGLDRAFT_745690 [Exidia glandulosa HHB12029]
MYSDAESDDDYTSYGSYHVRKGSLKLRILDDNLYEIKDHSYTLLSESMLNERDNGSTSYKTDKERMRANIGLHDRSWSDWRRVRLQRAFREVEGFHKGCLDLTGRHPARYVELLKRYARFVADLGSLNPYVRFEVHERCQYDNATRSFVPVSVSVPVVPSEQWTALRERWKISSHLTYEDVITWMRETQIVLQEHELPKFQELRLVQLPPELLITVFEYADIQDGRALSATCKDLRNIGLSYIFSTRRIAMTPPNTPLHRLIASDDATAVHAGVYDLMKKSREDCIQQVQFLSSRPDIFSRVRSLTLGNFWRESMYDGTILGDAILRPSHVFFDPLLEQFTGLLRHLQLETLTLWNLSIDIFFGLELAQQPLSLLRLRQCRPRPDLRAAVRNAEWPSSIKGLDIQFAVSDTNDVEEIEQFKSWYLLAVCPQLRLLHVTNALPRQRLPFPAAEIWPCFSGLNTVERVHLDGIECELDELVGMIEHAAARGPLRISHLKLTSAWSMSEDDILLLLRALHAGGSPLIVLDLDGIYPLTTALFDGLASMFPDLVALTLIRRDGLRQHDAKLCNWDRPVYEYAAHMRSFAHLRHFGANFYVPDLHLSPFAMRHIESDFQHQEDISIVPASADYISDTARSIALPFAANCPSLESFFVATTLPLYQYTIRRLPGGVFEVEDRRNSKKGGMPYNPEWNSSYVGDTFPLPPT